MPMTAPRVDRNKVLDFQEIRSNGTITLRKRTLEYIDAKPGDWVAIFPGQAPGTIVIKVMDSKEFQPDIKD